MHAMIRKTLFYNFKLLISEGQVYIMAYFGVGGNIGNFYTTRHEFRLNFQLRTTLRPTDTKSIPIYGRKLVPFDEILQADGDFPYLVGILSSFKCSFLVNVVELANFIKSFKCFHLCCRCHGCSNYCGD